VTRNRFWIAGVLLSACAVPASAQDDDEQIWFNTTWVEASVCNSEIATPVDLTALAQNPRQWAGDCVAVRGYSGGFALFSDSQDAGRVGAWWAEDLKGRRVGLYGKDGFSDLVLNSEDGTMLAIGHVGLCEDLWAEFDFVSNYCHSASGAFIALMHDGSPADAEEADNSTN